MSILKMAPNIPVEMKIRFVDVWANDPSKDYGSQVSVKGEANGERDTTIYLRGFTNANIGQLEAAGVIAKDDYQHDPAAKYNIPVVNGDVTLILDQPAGEKYAKLKVTPKTNGKPIVAKGKEKVELSVGTLPGEASEASDPWADLVKKQRQCIAEALHDAQKMKELGLTADEIRSVFAGAATLLIQRSREGI